jgi:hypothetical protein
MIGQDVPLIAPHNPVSVASIGTPGFATAGNLWLWLPQVRATIETSTRLHLGVQGAVLAPSSGDAAAAFDTDFDVAERSSRPTLQARARARWGDRDIGGEIGCGAHLGWMAVDRGTAPDGGSMIESNAVACDARIPFLRRLELRAEAYRGQALRGLGGGGIGQGIGPGSRPVHDEGGWAQLLVTPVFSTTFAMGCGVDDPDDADLPTTGRLRNAACSVSAQLRPVDPMFIGIEFRRITTTYASGRYANDHFNLGIGFVY